MLLSGGVCSLRFLLNCNVKAIKQYFSRQTAYVFHFCACLSIGLYEKLILFFSSTVFPQQLTSPDQPFPSRAPPPRPKLFCLIKIRMLFLETCGSFSETRRDLCSSYFYCRSNSLEKNVICKKALFLSALRVKLNILYRAGGWGRCGERRESLPESPGHGRNAIFPGRARLSGRGPCGRDLVPFRSVPPAARVSVPVFVEAECPEAKREGTENGRENPSSEGAACRRVLLTMETLVAVSKERLGARASGRSQVVKSAWFPSLTGFTRSGRGRSERWLTSPEKSPSM